LLIMKILRDKSYETFKEIIYFTREFKRSEVLRRSLIFRVGGKNVEINAKPYCFVQINSVK